ncbi:MAG: SEC-C domain-containing protein [Phycisphaerales bacterium]|nr:SEC-C domain-containing protein [Phycisphaerales bacterium]
MNPFTRQNLENWAADYANSDRIRRFSPATREFAAALLTEFVVAACAKRAVEPDDLQDADVKQALLSNVARMQLPASARAEAPALCADFLAALEEEGRLANGRVLGAFVRALGPAFEEASGGKQKPITNPGSKLGRNDPCPCGSGQKFKKCCMK